MKTIFSKIFNRNKADLKDVAQRHLDKNIKVVESLRDYDQGKKDILTSDIREHLPNIRVTS